MLTLDFRVPTGKDTRYPTDEAVWEFYDTVARDVAALPEVPCVGWASSLLYGTSELGRWMFEIVGDPPVCERLQTTAGDTVADPGETQTLDLPIVYGRGFTERDASQRSGVPGERSVRGAPATSRAAIRLVRVSGWG